MISLDILVPGIVPPAAAASGDYPLPRPPALERVLSYANRRDTQARSFEGAVFEHLGFAAGAGQLPVAAATHWVDFDGGHDGIWMRADPVVLRPDLGQLLLQHDRVETLTPPESSDLVTELNAGLQGSGLVLKAGRDGSRWYLRLPALPAMTTQSPLAALGSHIDPFLPRGEDAGHWHRLGNDLQMLLHGSRVNAERLARGVDAVNSVWFWGAGRLGPPAGGNASKVCSDEPLAQGLALAVGSELLTGTAFDPEALAGGGTRAVIGDGWRASRLDAPQAWEAALLRLESGWFEPLLRMLRCGRIEMLRVHTLTRCFELRPSFCRRFWRRPQPLSTLI
jgi:hypothetical protein